MRTPALGKGLFNQNAYEFPTSVGTFQVPAALCMPGRFDRFCDLLEDSLRADLETDAFIQRCERELSLRPEEWDNHAVALTRDLYNTMLNLHQRGMNGLWARLLKNNFAPLTVGRFDCIVGNPPWVNWENLPDGYRQAIKPIWERYGLFPHGGMDTILGKGKKDIAMLMTFTVTDGLLKDGGKLGFVITQSLFKTSGAGQGFRRFRIPQGNGQFTPLAVVHVDDMVSLNPFEGASNRTAVMVLQKGKPTKYPVPYTVWRKTKGARFTYDSTLDDVTAATERLQFQAEPVDPNDSTSPWLTAHPKALRAICKILGKSDYEAHAGAYTGGANAVYWVEKVLERPDGLVVVRNLTEGAKVKVEEVTEPIEPDLLYPLLRGRDVQRWKAEPSALILLTHEPGMRLKAIPEKEMQTRYPRTYGYLKRFERVLRQRASRGVSDMLKKGAPFYTMFAVGDYTFAPWKVVWREQASAMTAAVVGTRDGKATVPDHKLMLVDCSSEQEAYFVCACLNSSLGQFIARSYAVEIQMNPHILEHTRIPRYEPSNPVHRRLAELSQAAHEAARRGDTMELQRIEAEIDRQAAQLWGLTEAELRAIQQSLRELAGESDVSAEAEE